MHELTLELDVDKGSEYSLKTIIDLLFCIDSTKTGNGQLSVIIDVKGDDESNSIETILGHLSHVNSVKEKYYQV